MVFSVTLSDAVVKTSSYWPARYAALSSVRSYGSAPMSRFASSFSIALMVSSMVSDRSSTLLADLGNASFGICPCHTLVLKAVWKLLGLSFMPLGVSTFAVWALTLAGLIRLYYFAVVICLNEFASL